MNPAKPILYRPSAEALLAAFRASGKRHLIITGTRGSGKTTLLQNFLRLQYPEREDSINCPFPFDLPGFTSWAVRSGEWDGFSETGSSVVRTNDAWISCKDKPYNSPEKNTTSACAYNHASISCKGRSDESSKTDSSSSCEDRSPASCGSAYAKVPSCIRLYDHCSRQSAVIGLPVQDCEIITHAPNSPYPMRGGKRMRAVPDGFLTVGLEALQNALRSTSAVAVLDEIGYLEESVPAFCDAIRKLFEKKNVVAVLRSQTARPAGYAGTPASDPPDSHTDASDSSATLTGLLRSRDDVFVLDLSAPLPHIGAVVMASGEGRRFRARLSGIHTDISELADCADPAFSGRLTGIHADVPALTDCADSAFSGKLSGIHADVPALTDCAGPAFSGNAAGRTAIAPQQSHEKCNARFLSAGYKLLADFHGEPLLAPVLRTASMPLIRSRIAVTRSSDVRYLCQTFDFPCILHDQPLLSDTICIGLLHLCGISETSTQQKHLSLHSISENALQQPDISVTILPLYCATPETPTQQHNIPEIDLPPHRDIPDACLFLQGDQPLVSPVSIEALILAFASDPQKIYRLAAHGTPGSPVLFPRTFFQELLQLPPDRGGNVVIRRHPEAVRLIEAQDARELLDADTPEDLRALALR